MQIKHLKWVIRLKYDVKFAHMEKVNKQIPYTWDEQSNYTSIFCLLKLVFSIQTRPLSYRITEFCIKNKQIFDIA